MQYKENARNSCNHPAHNDQQLPRSWYMPSITENYKRGAYGAAVVLCLMFVVLAVGCVMFGW